MNELVPELLIGAVRLAEEEVPFLRKEKEFKVVVFFVFKSYWQLTLQFVIQDCDTLQSL